MASDPDGPYGEWIYELELSEAIERGILAGLRVPDRAALAGVMYVLRTGVAWRDVPAEAVGCSGVRPGAGCGTGPRPVSGPACTPSC